jgi:ATP-binding cassette subfamily F protein 3
MDEPTNHLDIKSKNVLKEALKRFEGTLILISHDRDFLQGLSEIVYEFKDKNIKEYIGDIDYYLDKRNIGDIREIEMKKDVKDPKKTDKDSYKKMKKIKSLSNKIQRVEKDIIELEETIKKNNLDLEQNPSDHDDKFFEEYQLRKNTLASSISKWEELEKELEKLKK